MELKNIVYWFIIVLVVFSCTDEDLVPEPEPETAVPLHTEKNRC